MDITIEDTKCEHLKTITFVTNLLNTVPLLKTMALILKKLLDRYELNVPFTGGMNSYSVLMLCASFLQTYGTSVATTGEALIKLLDYYANLFNNSVYGIFYNGSIVYACSDSVLATKNHRTYYALPQRVDEESLVVIDPMNPANNLAANVYRFQDIRGCFQEVLDALMDDSGIVLEHLLNNKMINH